MDAKFNYAGFCAATRAEIIADMRKRGLDQQTIDRYLTGLERKGPVSEKEARELLTFQECVELEIFE